MRDTPPPFSFTRTADDPALLQRAAAMYFPVREMDANHLPWRKFRHVARERGLNPEDAWAAAKMVRIASWRFIGLDRDSAMGFGYCASACLLEALHRADRALGGGGVASLESERGLLSDNEHRRRLRIRTLMDEAAESSLIEGAATTRKDAVDLLRSRRDPKTKGERMVVNNFAAMQYIKQNLKNPLSIDLLLELQGILTEGTLDDSGESRRLRRADEAVRVENDMTGDVIFTPPSATGLELRLRSICNFANREHKGQEFIHPIVKASILHFMIGYEHPFVDGNGRTARAVFYWFALRSGYTIFEYIPISERIRAGRARYPQAYLDTEQDDGDLTYFILYKLDIIDQALDALAKMLDHEEEKIKQSERLLKLSKSLNLRQRLLLGHALRHPTTRYTTKSHSTSTDITLATARADLDGLVRLRLMTTTKRGREVIYHPSPSLLARLRRKGV